MKKILVFGGAGFLGTHLCRSLLGDEEPNYVICVDNCITGNIKNIQYMLHKNPNFEYVRHDIRDPCNIVADEIYNLACPASPKAYQRRPLATIDTSFDGMKNVCKLAEETNAKILQASTSEIYGDPKEHPQTESYWGNVNTIGARSCYDEGKRIAETICYEYRKKGVDIRIARIFNTYGPNMAIDDGRVVSNFINQALHDKPITVYGKGDQTRSFCYVSDMVRGLKSLMLSEIISLGPVNLGNPKEFTVLQLAEMVIKLTGSSSEIIYEELPEDDPVKRKPDISLAYENLQFTPKRSLKFGLIKTIEYFQRKMKDE